MECPTNTEVIRRRDLGLKSHPEDWRRGEGNRLRVHICLYMYISAKYVCFQGSGNGVWIGKNVLLIVCK